MTAIKKNTTKSLTSPAPATKTKPAKSAAKKKAVAAPVPATPVPAAPAVKAVEIKPAQTTITAKIDVGFGNSLYLRGQGAGLSWDRGQPMACVADDLWQIKLPASERPLAVKFLINDMNWSIGPDFVVAAGESVTLTPQFC